MTKQVRLGSIFNTLLKEYTIVIGIIALVLITSIVEPRFMTSGNMVNIMRQFGPLILVALGMTFVILAGFIDLSVTGQLFLVAVIVMKLIDPIGQLPAMIVGVAFGGLFGYFNSKVIIFSGALTQAEALFITYGLSTAYIGIGQMISNGKTMNMSIDLTSSYSMFQYVGLGFIGPFSISFVIFLVAIVILYFFQSKTYMGRSVMLTGGNKTAARIAGIPIYRSITIVYMICGIMTAIGAIVFMSRATTVTSAMSIGLETDVILAVVLGGTYLGGGRGSVLRTIIGALIVILISNCMNLLGITIFWQDITRGAILIIAIWLDAQKNN
jgi:ribose transport system permease protein